MSRRSEKKRLVAHNVREIFYSPFFAGEQSLTADTLSLHVPFLINYKAAKELRVCESTEGCEP